MSTRRCPTAGRTDRPDRGRRRTLRWLGAFAAGAAAQAVAGAGCAGGDQPPAATRVALDQLPLGERVRVLYGETPVELVRHEDGVEARSLWCTHYGCEVVWDGAAGSYLCPCHDGVFDARGRVVSGPPPRSLRGVTIRLAEGAVFIDGIEP